MGVDVNFNLSSDSKFNQYRKDVEKEKTIIEIRTNNPLYWYKVTPNHHCPNVIRFTEWYYVQWKWLIRGSITGRITIRLGLTQII